MSERSGRGLRNLAGVGRPTLLAAGAVMVALLAGVGVLTGAEHWLGVVVDKPPVPLQKPLPELAEKIGPYESRGRALDQRLDEEFVSTLGTQDYLLRDYYDKRKAEGTAGSVLALNLNFYPTGSATPHVPDVCWVGNGMVPAREDFFVVPGVKHRDGTTSDIRMRMISFLPQGRDPSDVSFGAEANRDHLVNVAYVFQVSGGRYVATKDEVAQDYWDPQAKYAYHTKIEITVKGACATGEAQGAIEEFVRTALAEIETCLPDPEVKTAGGGAGAATTDVPGKQR